MVNRFDPPIFVSPTQVRSKWLLISGSDSIAGQSEVTLVDPSFRPSAHVLFNECGRQKSQSCRFGQLETLFKLATWLTNRCPSVLSRC